MWSPRASKTRARKKHLPPWVVTFCRATTFVDRYPRPNSSHGSRCTCRVPIRPASCVRSSGTARTFGRLSADEPPDQQRMDIPQEVHRLLAEAVLRSARGTSYGGNRDGAPAAGVEVERDVGGGHRHGVEVALRRLAANVADGLVLILGLDSLGRDSEVEHMGELGDGRDDRASCSGAADIGDEALVDLDDVDRQST